MPFVANTPESLIGRSDSKNPAATCRGITANGRPCRRPIQLASPPSTLFPRRGSAAEVAKYDPRDESLYCWQHKEQASRSARSSPGPRATATPILEERTSIDTLADRLGLVELEQKAEKRRRHQDRPQNGRAGASTGSGSPRPPVMARPKPKKQLQFCWCFTIPIEEVGESPPSRPQPRPIQNGGVAPVPRPAKASAAAAAYPSAPPSSSRPRPSVSAASPARSSRKPSTASQTAHYLSLIPPTTDPQTASALMAELARPYVDSEEQGYIYMFWMTPESDRAPPPVEAARSLLAPPSPARPDGRRRASDVVSSFAAGAGGGAKKTTTMLLKIGRAANVQRRMNQWSRQCGYDVELIRYYPYLPGASEASGATPRTTPHCKRVERLVHIELAGMGMRAELNGCAACGKEHREWFKVKATREGVRAVDEVIRRWVGWDEMSGA